MTDLDLIRVGSPRVAPCRLCNVHDDVTDGSVVATLSTIISQVTQL